MRAIFVTFKVLIYRRPLLALMITSVLLTSCGSTKDLPSRRGYGNGRNAGPLGIVFDASVPQNQRALLEGDLNALASVNIPDKNKYKEYVGVSDFSAPALTRWLSDRVGMVVGENFDWQTNAVKGETRTYNPSILSRSQDELSKVVTVMFNLGAYLYLDGRDTSRLYNLAVSGTSIPITTPRVGIIQIGEGLFSSASSIAGSPTDSLANRLLRVAVLFHEARHTDGNKAHAAFPHAKCTMQGSYFDKNACENNLNGPYVVESVMLWHFYQACVGCTSTELEGLSLYVSDNISRLQEGATLKDDRPEGI